MKATGAAFLIGGSFAAVFFLAFKFGVDMVFRATAAFRRRREAQERTQS